MFASPSASATSSGSRFQSPARPTSSSSARVWRACCAWPGALVLPIAARACPPCAVVLPWHAVRVAPDMHYQGIIIECSWCLRYVTCVLAGTATQTSPPCTRPTSPRNEEEVTFQAAFEVHGTSKGKELRSGFELVGPAVWERPKLSSKHEQAVDHHDKLYHFMFLI